MAAPQSEFIQKKIGDMTNSVSKLCDVGVYDANVATLKTRYYLDFVRGVVEYDANLNEIPSKTGFIGGCFIGSDNYYMHNTARHWSVGALTASNEVLFNDAGKNTLDVAYWTTSPIIAYANYIIIPSFYKAAWHVNSSRIGYQVRKYGTTDWITPTPTRTLAQRQTITENSNIIVFGNPYQNGDRLELRAFNTNAEGTYYSQIIEVVVGDNITFYPADFRGASPVCTDGTPTSVILSDADREWLKTFTNTGNIATGRYIYGSINENTGALSPAPAGWYQGLIVGNQQRLIQINASGEIRSSFLCSAPITEVLLASFTRQFGLGDDFTVTITVNRTTAFTVPITISGTIQELNGASVMRSFPFDVFLPANAMSADSTVFGKLNPAYKFHFTAATATPAQANSINTNPVRLGTDT